MNLHRPLAWWASSQAFRKQIRVLRDENGRLRTQLGLAENAAWWATETSSCSDPNLHVRLRRDLDRALTDLAIATGVEPHKASAVKK